MFFRSFLAQRREMYQTDGMSIASDARWVMARWPGLTQYAVAKLLGTSVMNVRAASQAAGFVESRERPSRLPPEVVEGATLEVVQAAAKAIRPPGAGVHTPWTQRLADAAQKYGLQPHAFVALVVESACTQALGE